ncbi:hypothetical protein BJ165DRAFT_1614407 [Panaeolus papilionaceus]|nr:hypothetical protein BJ165DRAFT_1614407 [Panaeolus papilionaceus]
MVSIPQEVSEIVIDLLATNSFTLKSCSLVCQLWLHASRKWLFQRLSINPDNYNRFFDAFQAEYPQIPRFTQYCTSLDISYADEWLFDLDGKAYKGFILHFSATLKGLSIRHTTAPSFDHLINTVLPFRSLRCFALDSVCWGKEKFDSITVAPCYSIESVHIRNTNVREFLALVPHTGVLGQVVSLETSPLKEETFVELAKFLFRHRSTLKHFAMFFEANLNFYVGTMEPTLRGVDPIQGETPIQTRYRHLYGTRTCHILNSLSNLRVARFEGFLDSRRSEQSVALYFVPRALASFSSPLLTRVVFMIYLERAGQVDIYGVNWAFLDEIFNSEWSTNLEVVLFENYGPANTAGLENLLTTRLPKSEDRGILRFCSILEQDRYSECPHH